MKTGWTSNAFCLSLCLLILPSFTFGALVQWDFNGNLDPTEGDAPLEAQAFPPAVQPEVEFTTEMINGEEAQVAAYSQGTCFYAIHNFEANGGGQYVNLYTVIMDIMYTDRAANGAWAALLQTNATNSNDGDWFVNPGGGIGISGNYGGLIEDNVWYRVALVVNLVEGTFTSYINGEQVQQNTGLSLDGRFSLYARDDPNGNPPMVYLFADNDGENWSGLVNSVQIRDYAMTAEEIAELGGPSAEGIPRETIQCEVTDPSQDCNENGVRDECDVRYGTSRDCNGNGVPDECEIENGTVADCNGNGIPDECELAGLDCDGNGVIDSCEIAEGTATDCNNNGIIDSCETGAVAQWDFNGDLSSSTGGQDLVPLAADPAFDPEVMFDAAEIDGAEAEVAYFGRGTYFIATHDLPPNGGGQYVNQYTVIMDVMFPDRSPSGGWAALWQTNDGNTNDGDWFINPEGGIGISGVYGGFIEDGRWYRLALVVDLVAGTLTSYINGEQVQQLTGLALDGRFSLYSSDSPQGPVALLFADENAENAEGYVNSVQIRGYAMTAEELLALGGPEADGIPQVDADGNGVPDECQGGEETQFVRGDTNADGSINIADAITILSYLFSGAEAPSCVKSADTNDDSQVNIADAIFVLGYLFGGGPDLDPPFKECGTDPTEDPLTCESFPPCGG